jgi:hypothetical protein
VLFLASLFLFIATKYSVSIQKRNGILDYYHLVFYFSITLIKVFITDRFMNKNWEREQLDRLISLQKKKDELQAKK